MGALFECRRKHNLKLSPSKARHGATDADFLGHSISPAGVGPSADKIYALNKMPMPRDLKQVCSLLGGVGYYRKSLRDLSKRIRPITSLLGKGVKFAFTIALEEIVRKIVAELAAPPILVFPDWDAVVDGSRPFNVYCGACIDGFGGALDRSNRTAPCGPSLTSAALPSILKGTGLRLIWRLAA